MSRSLYRDICYDIFGVYITSFIIYNIFIYCGNILYCCTFHARVFVEKSLCCVLVVASRYFLCWLCPFLYDGVSSSVIKVVGWIMKIWNVAFAFGFFCQHCLTLTCVVLIGRSTFILALNQCQYLSRTDMSVQDLQILGAEAVFAPKNSSTAYLLIFYLFLPTVPLPALLSAPQWKISNEIWYSYLIIVHETKQKCIKNKAKFS